MKKLFAVILVCIFAVFAFPKKQIYAAETDKNDRLNYIQHEPVADDVNADSEFNIADVVLLQKWLLAVPDTKLADWKAGDLCEDDRIMEAYKYRTTFAIHHAIALYEYYLSL